MLIDTWGGLVGFQHHSLFHRILQEKMRLCPCQGSLEETDEGVCWGDFGVAW